MWTLKHDTDKLIYKIETIYTDVENKLTVTKGEREWERGKLGDSDE